MRSPGLEEARPSPLLVVPLDGAATRTGEVAADRSALPKDEVREAPSARRQLPSDQVLIESPAVVGPMNVFGLGPLPEDARGLQLRVTRLVRGQGLSEVARRLAEARRTAEGTRAALLRHGRSGAHPAELSRRVQVMQAFLPSFVAERDEVQSNLLPHVVAEAHAGLDAASARVDRLQRQYFDPGALRPEALLSLRRDAQTLLGAWRSAAAASGPAREAALAGYAALHREVSARHPLLEAFDFDTPELSKLQDLASDVEPDEYEVLRRRPEVPLRGMLDDLRAAILDMKDELRSDPEVVWRLPGVVDATLIRHGIPARGMVAAHARDVVRERARDDALVRGFVSILSVGLGVAAALPSGGTSLAAGAAAATALDGYQLYLGVRDYELAAAASGTTIDRRRALSDQVPSAGWLAFDVVGAAAGAAGTLAGIRKSAFSRMLAKDGPVGDMARGLELRLGAERAALVVDHLGEARADLLFRDLSSEVWHGLAEASPAQLDAMLSTLAEEGLLALDQALGGARAGGWIGQVPAAGWQGLATTLLSPQEVLRIAERLSPEQVGHLAPPLKGRGLVELTEHLGDASLATAADYVVVDGQLRLNAHQALRLSKSGELDPLRRRLVAARASSPSFAQLGHLTPDQLRRLERAADDVISGRVADVQAPDGLAAHAGRTKPLVVRVIREMADRMIHLSARVETLAQAAPELRAGLEVLETSGIGEAMRSRTYGLLEEAISRRTVTIDRAHLGELLRKGVAPLEHPEGLLDSHLLELEYALHVVDSGEAAPGSTVFLGVGPGERVQLSPGGPWVELPVPKQGDSGVLQDIDVLFLTTAGEIQAVEVKRSGRALWGKFKETRGRYLGPFARWRADGGPTQKRKLAVAIRLRDDGYLDETIPNTRQTPREMLDEAGVELRGQEER